MKAKKQLQEIVSRLRTSLPKEDASLADEVHRAAGEARREYASLQRALSEAKRQSEQLRQQVATLRNDNHALVKDTGQLRRRLDEQEKECRERALPFHDTVTDTLLELSSAVGVVRPSLSFLRVVVASGNLQLDATPDTPLVALSAEDTQRMLDATVGIARQAHSFSMAQNVNTLGIEHHHPEIADAIYNVACKRLVDLYCDNGCAIPLHPCLVALVASTVLRTSDDVRRFLKTVSHNY